ncbi:MAG: hypothetical protein A2X94_17240 [Bdellovibrionales bacterium GWB1_55_8]|nr:MAG: hypothetical protein A2X94_17240 [Bdellovibrionales bacterium GWB1_55_8]
MSRATSNRILVVDDEPSIVQAYADFLVPSPANAPKKSSRVAQAPSASAGSPEFEILTASSGEQALAVFKQELAAGRRIAGGFFDVKMPGALDGLQAIQEIWKTDAQMHCTVVTAYHDRSVNDIDQLFGPAFKDQWDYLNKPFTQAEIVQKARQMLAAWNRMRSLEYAMEQLKAAQEQLVRSERMAAVGQVARGIGHEFGNLLQAIMGKADLALADSDPGKVRERLNLIISAADRASLIVRNLQSFSRTDSAAPKPVQLSTILKDTLLLVNHELKKRSIDVVDATSTETLVLGNAGELEQVVMNLVINAMHAMPSGGRLEIGCGPNGDSVHAWVADTGTGIAPEVLPRIFDFAYTTKGDHGSGLGLSISRQLLEKHGGKILVETQAGKGTKFILMFPGDKR